MTLRQPYEDAVLPAADVAMIRQVAAAAAGAAEAAGFSRAPGALAGQASLAIDYLDFADAAGSDL